MVAEKPNVNAAARYSLKEAAKLLKLSRTTLWRYINHGKVRFGVRECNGAKYITGFEILRIWTKDVTINV